MTGQLGLWRRLCECWRPIVDTDDDGDVTCIRCGRPTDALGPPARGPERRPTYPTKEETR